MNQKSMHLLAKILTASAGGVYILHESKQANFHPALSHLYENADTLREKIELTVLPLLNGCSSLLIKHSPELYGVMLSLLERDILLREHAQFIENGSHDSLLSGKLNVVFRGLAQSVAEAALHNGHGLLLYNPLNGKSAFPQEVGDIALTRGGALGGTYGFISTSVSFEHAANFAAGNNQSSSEDYTPSTVLIMVPKKQLFIADHHSQELHTKEYECPLLGIGRDRILGIAYLDSDNKVIETKINPHFQLNVEELDALCLDSQMRGVIHAIPDNHSLKEMLLAKVDDRHCYIRAFESRLAETTEHHFERVNKRREKIERQIADSEIHPGFESFRFFKLSQTTGVDQVERIEHDVKHSTLTLPT